MENKLAFWMLTLSIGILAFAACKPPQSGHFLKKAVASADSLVLYKVDGYPTLPAEQKTGTFYLQGYAVIEKVALDAAAQKAIKDALLDPATFDSAAVKSCPMVATMAIDLWHKGKSITTVVMSPLPCGKAILFDASKPKKPIYMELAMGNRLEELVFR